jgi:hypothetical protein
LQGLRHTVRGELIVESRKHAGVKLLRQIPFIGPLRAAQLVALMQTPHRFRSKRQLWTYNGLAVVTHDSAQYRYVDGQLQRSKKPQQLRGLNQNHNHAIEEIFKSAALSATLRPGPFQDFYASLLVKGMKPEMARLTLARKITAITLTLWKKGACFDAGYVKPQAACGSRRIRPLLRFSCLTVANRFSRRSGRGRVSSEFLGALACCSFSAEISMLILCPLVQPNKAIGLESHIGSSLARYLWPTLLLAQLQEPTALNQHGNMKPCRNNRNWPGRAQAQASGWMQAKELPLREATGSYSSLTTSLIGKLTVNPRVGQMAVRFSF